MFKDSAPLDGLLWHPNLSRMGLSVGFTYLSLSVESPSATDPKFAVEVASDAPVRIRHTVADASTKVVVGPYVIGALRSRCGRRVIECDGAKVGAKIMT